MKNAACPCYSFSTTIEQTRVWSAKQSSSDMKHLNICTLTRTRYCTVLMPTGWCAKRTENQPELSTLSQWQLLITETWANRSSHCCEVSKNCELPFNTFTALMVATRTRRTETTRTMKTKRTFACHFGFLLWFVLVFSDELQPDTLFPAAF